MLYYISLIDMARRIEQWLKDKDDVLFLSVWELFNSTGFNSLKFEGIKGDADLFPSPACGRGVRGEGFVFPIKKSWKIKRLPLSPAPLPQAGEGRKPEALIKSAFPLRSLYLCAFAVRV